MQAIAPYLRKKVESFEQDEDLADFRAKVKEAAEGGKHMFLLSLTGNSYGSGFFRELRPYLEKIPSIERVSLSDIFTQRLEDLVQSLEILSVVLQGKQIRLLDISNNAVTPNGCETIFNWIKSLQQLEYFYANNCGLAQNGVIWVAKALEEGHLPVKVISMTRNRIETKAVDVARAIKSCAQLEELTLSQNGIREQGMVALLEACAELSNLRKLEINDNVIMGDAKPRLPALIEKVGSLVFLNISDLNIEVEDNKDILAAMKKTPRDWEGFCHDYNEMEDPEVGRGIFEELARGGKLTKLSLKGNEVEEDLQETIRARIAELKLPLDKVDFESDYEEDEEEEEPQETPDVVEYKALMKRYQTMVL